MALFLLILEISFWGIITKTQIKVAEQTEAQMCPFSSNKNCPMDFLFCCTEDLSKSPGKPLRAALESLVSVSVVRGTNQGFEEYPRNAFVHVNHWISIGGGFVI